jgi:hypothetical protein
LNRNFDFNKTPLAPPWTKVVIHLKPDQRASWSYHGEEGWYVGPSMEHYRCVKCYIPTAARERDVDTLQFFPKKIPFPSISTEDYLKQAASNILAILPKTPSSLPYLAYGDPTNNAIVQIATLLGRAVAAPPSPQFPTQPPRVPIEVHPPRVHIPLLPPPKVLSPTVQISKPLPSKSQPALPRVQVPRQSRLQQRRGLSYTGPQAPSLQHMHAIQTFHHHVNHIYNDQGKKETIDTLLAGNVGPTWTNALCNEYG